MKKFLVGFVIGALIAFHLGINFGRNRPLWSNPYEKDVVAHVKEQAGQAMEQTKDAIHQATEPARKELDKRTR
jgi:adenine/guanine phosphoribosyltransferase-like PRPP-binding protein